MKLITLIVVVLTSTALAQHPIDFVPDDALAVLSIKEGATVNAILKTINEKSGVPIATTDALQSILSQYIDNPNAIDFDSEILIILEPTTLGPNQKPTGMFGPMPHFMIVCKGIEGKTLKANKAGGMKTETIVDGWYIATGADRWSPRSSSGLSPILNNLPKAQISSVINFSPLWSKFAPIVQMTGGMAVGGLNKPGPGGVITPETKKAAKAARDAFGDLMNMLGDIDVITTSINFESYTAVVSIDIDSKSDKSPMIDNSAMLQMATNLTSSTAQYGMSGKLTSKLMSLDIASVRKLASDYFGGAVPFISPSYALLADLTESNVVSYGIDGNNGLTISCLSEVTNQDAYLKLVPGILNESSSLLLTSFNMKLTQTDAPLTWNVSSGSTYSKNEEIQKIIDVVLKKSDQVQQVQFGKQGTSRIAMMFGPSSWKAFSQSHSTALSQVIRKHASTVDIDFALSIDFRKYFSGISELVRIAYGKDEESLISSTPSAKNSILFGTTTSGTFIELRSDLYGFASLLADINAANAKSILDNQALGAGIGALAGQRIGAKDSKVKLLQEDKKSTED